MVDAPRLSELAGHADERRTVHEFVRETLRRAILSGTLSGGTRLVQADIAAQLGVSTTPVREALRDLAADGLIRFDAHRGAVVPETNLEELKEVYEIRVLLEPFSMRKAAERITEAELRQAGRLHEQMQRLRDPGRWVEINWRFHALIQRSANSPRLAAITKAMQDAAALYVAHSIKLDPTRMVEGNREHQALLDALRRRDADAAARTLQEHLEATLRAILSGHDSQAPAG